MSEDPPAGADRTAAPGALVDAAGRVHQSAGANARIVSLVPSITETLFALDLGSAVVGRTAFCVHPRGQVERVQSVGGTKRINAAKLHALAPTHVIVNIDETPRAMAEQLAGAGYCVVVTHPVEVDDNRGLYRLLGALFGREDQADDLRRRFDVAAASLAAAASALPERRVLYLIWKDPWMTVSPATYIARLLARVHWQVIGGDGVARYPEVTLDDRLLDATDLVLFSTEPFPFAERHLEAFRAAHPAHAHKAVLVDGEMTSWYGSRAIAGLRYLAAFARDHCGGEP